MDADAGLHCFSLPSLFLFPQPPALPFVDLALLLNFSCQYDVILDEIEKENQTQLFVSGLFASLSSSQLSFGAAVLFRCKS